MPHLTVEDLIRAARGAGGARLATIGGRANFTVRVRSDDRPIFVPDSTGRERTATNWRRLEEVVAIYNRTSSLRVTAYRDVGSRNLSYILRLVQMAVDGK